MSKQWRAMRTTPDGTIQWHDGGVGNFAVSKVSTGLYSVTYPEKAASDKGPAFATVSKVDGIAGYSIAQVIQPSRAGCRVQTSAGGSNAIVADNSFSFMYLSDTTPLKWNAVSESNNNNVAINFSSLAPQAGDTLFAIWVWDGAGTASPPGPSAPAGWSIIYSECTPSSSLYPSIFLLTKVSDGTETTVSYTGSTDFNPVCKAVWCSHQAGGGGSYGSSVNNNASTGIPVLIANPDQLTGEQVLCIVTAEDDNITFTPPAGVEVLVNVRYSTSSAVSSSLGIGIYDTTTNAEVPPQWGWPGGNDGNAAFTIRMLNP